MNKIQWIKNAFVFAGVAGFALVVSTAAKAGDIDAGAAQGTTLGQKSGIGEFSGRNLECQLLEKNLPAEGSGSSAHEARIGRSAASSAE
jgi:hypothetical protein